MARKCYFGRQHSWMSRGRRGAIRVGHDLREVYLCTTCGLVEGTDRKVELGIGGGLFKAERLAAQEWGGYRLGRAEVRRLRSGQIS